MEIFKLFGRVLVETSGAEQNLDKTESKAKTTMGRLGELVKKGIAFAGTLGTAVATLKKAMDLASQVADKGDAIDKNSQKIGISAKAYQEWDAVLQHSGTSMDKMGGAFKTLAQAAQNASDAQIEAFDAVGISAEELADLTTEELWARTISGLQSFTDGTYRSNLAMTLLGEGAQELGALFNTSAEDTQNMIDRVSELGGVMDDDAVAAAAHYKDNIQDLQTVVDGLKTQLGEKLLPVLNGITDWILDHSEDISGFFSNVEEFFERAQPKLETYFSDLGSGIADLRDAFSNLNSVLGKMDIKWSVTWSNMEAVASSAFPGIREVINGITTLINGIAWAAQNAYQWYQNLITARNSYSWSSGTSSGRYGSFANGKDYIPFDGYTATLHKGERVLTAEENAAYSRNETAGSGLVINQYIQSVQQSPVQLAAATEAAFAVALWT